MLTWCKVYAIRIQLTSRTTTARNSGEIHIERRAANACLCALISSQQASETKEGTPPAMKYILV